MAAPIPSREARPATTAWNVAKTLVQTVIFWSMLLFFIPAMIYGLEGAMGLGTHRFGGPSWRVAGTVVFVLGGALGLTSGMIMAIRGRGTPLPLDCTRELVVAGPYRYVRNPMAIAGLSQGAAVGLYLGSASVLAYVLAGLLIWNFGVRPGEEADLEARFGEAYRAYRSRVRCWRVRLCGYEPGRDASPSRLSERPRPGGTFCSTMVIAGSASARLAICRDWRPRVQSTLSASRIRGFSTGFPAFLMMPACERCTS